MAKVIEYLFVTALGCGLVYVVIAPVAIATGQSITNAAALIERTNHG